MSPRARRIMQFGLFLDALIVVGVIYWYFLR